MEEKTYCPYCAASEENPNGVEMVLDEPMLYKAKGRNIFLARCFCAKCQCSSPIMFGNTREESRAKAIAAALNRCTPFLKPLTWHEAIDDEDDHYLEIKGDEYIDVALLQSAFATEGKIANCDKAVFTTHSEDGLTLLAVDYGKTWRCWTRRPTEEERKAAKWREDNMQEKQAEGQRVQAEQLVKDHTEEEPTMIDTALARMPRYDQQQGNKIVVSGWLAHKLTMTHEIEGKPFYEGMLRVKRLSGYLDELWLLIPGSVHDAANLDYKSKVRIEGELRAYKENDPANDGKTRLRVKVFAHKMAHVDAETEDENSVDIAGALSKTPILRHAPAGKTICDLMLTVKSGSGKKSYIPCVVWGKAAERAARYHIGEEVRIGGRLQSRDYKKMNERLQYETRTVHEISAYAVYKEIFGGV